jgi:hypothetical protein
MSIASSGSPHGYSGIGEDRGISETATIAGSPELPLEVHDIVNPEPAPFPLVPAENPPKFEAAANFVWLESGVKLADPSVLAPTASMRRSPVAVFGNGTKTLSA